MRKTSWLLGLMMLISLIACRPAQYGLDIHSVKFFASSDAAPIVFKLDGTDTVAVPAGSFLIVEFNELLDGDTIEQVNCEKTAAGKCRLVGEEQYKGAIPVVSGFTPIRGVVTVEFGPSVNPDSTCAPNVCLTSYHPDGGYTPDPATPASEWPKAAIRIDFASSITAAQGTTVVVNLTTAIKSASGQPLPATKTITFNVQ